MTLWDANAAADALAEIGGFDRYGNLWLGMLAEAASSLDAACPVAKGPASEGAWFESILHKLLDGYGQH